MAGADHNRGVAVKEARAEGSRAGMTASYKKVGVWAFTLSEMGTIAGF